MPSTRRNFNCCFDLTKRKEVYMNKDSRGSVSVARKGGIVLSLGLVVWFVSPAESSSAAPAEKNDPVVANVGDALIRASQLDAAADQHLRGIRSQEYTIKRAVLDELITEAVLQQAANARHLTVEASLTAQTDDQVSDITAAEATAVYDTSHERIRRPSSDE